MSYLSYIICFITLFLSTMPSHAQSLKGSTNQGKLTEAQAIREDSLKHLLNHIAKDTFRQQRISGKRDFLNGNKVYQYETAYLLLGNKKRLREAIVHCDSLIRLIETGQATGFTRIVKTYRDKAHLLLLANQPIEACLAYERAMNVLDSLIQKEYAGQVEALRLTNHVDKLELEKATLTSQNQIVGVVFSLCILSIVLSIGIYYYRSLKKTRKLQNEIERQSIKAQESERMKSAFINSICHEIRTPLNSINGFSEILTDETTSVEEKLEYHKIIRENTHLLTSLLDSLLEVANLDSLTESLPLEEIEITEICRAEMEFLRKTEGKKQVAYLLKMPEKSYIAHSHEQYLSLLLRSLLNNANKFTEQGSITLQCTNDFSHNQILISVTDTGCGIPPDQHEYIFQRFTKLDTFAHGNGLGLYLCRLIAQHMHGDIQVDPEVMQGSRFIFTLPMGKSRTK